jgi:hypothetical protein
MNFLHLATSGSAIALSSILGSANHDMSNSVIVFTVLVSIAAFAGLLTIAVLAGAWKKLSPHMPREISIGSVSGVALILMCALMVVVYRQETRRHPARPKPATNEVFHRPTQIVPPTKVPANAAKQPLSVKEPPQLVPAKKASPAKAITPLQKSPPVNLQVVKAAPKASVQEHVRPSSRHFEIARVTPPSVASSSASVTAPSPRQTSLIAALRPLEVSERSRKTIATAAPLAKKAFVGRGIKLLSDSQSRQLCGEVSLFPGTEVYIKWSPRAGGGSNPEKLANQLSKVINCARIVVTYASEQPGLESHGVQVATHSEEGETSDRIRPFADAIAAALREQGFNVAEVSGPNIPANQTAIFIGSD